MIISMILSQHLDSIPLAYIQNKDRHTSTLTSNQGSTIKGHPAGSPSLMTETIQRPQPVGYHGSQALNQSETPALRPVLP